MFEKSDQRFLQALDSPEEFEKRLKKLRFGRKILTVYTLSATVASVVMLFVGKDIASGFPEMSFFFPIIFGIKVTGIHSEIRTLLVFKKLGGSRSGEKHG